MHKINDIKNGKTTEKISKPKSWSFEKLNKIDKYLAGLIKKKKKTQITRIRNERRNIITNLS